MVITRSLARRHCGVASYLAAPRTIRAGAPTAVAPVVLEQGDGLPSWRLPRVTP